MIAIVPPLTPGMSMEAPITNPLMTLTIIFRMY
jgi:hypothetical protein